MSDEYDRNASKSFKYVEYRVIEVIRRLYSRYKFVYTHNNMCSVPLKDHRSWIPAFLSTIVETGADTQNHE